MKIRNGFVANSSSTSFCIYGTRIDSSSISDEEAYDTLYDNAEKLDLSFYSLEDGDTYIGRSYLKLKDDETGKQFKERTEKDVKKLIEKEELEFNSYEDIIYN